MICCFVHLYRQVPELQHDENWCFVDLCCDVARVVMLVEWLVSSDLSLAGRPAVNAIIMIDVQCFRDLMGEYLDFIKVMLHMYVIM